MLVIADLLISSTSLDFLTAFSALTRYGLFLFWLSMVASRCIILTSSSFLDFSNVSSKKPFYRRRTSAIYLMYLSRKQNIWFSLCFSSA